MSDNFSFSEQPDGDGLGRDLPAFTSDRTPAQVTAASPKPKAVFAGYTAQQLILGAVLALTGLGLLSGNELARVVAVFLLAVNAVMQVVWFPAAPLWALLIIVLDVVIIWQLINDWVEHGST